MTAYLDLGPLVLAGSGEYTPLMDLVDSYLIKVSPSKPVVLIATSCAQEGADVMTRWEQMGVAHFARLGVEAQPLRIADSADADQSDIAERIAEAGIVWFSGGSPAYLAQSFFGTRSWTALETANRGGAAIAGASGGLGVLNDHVNTPAGPGPGGAPQTVTTAHVENPYSGPNALGLAAPLRALAHFDRMEQRRPEFIGRILDNLQPDQMAIGVDEDTAAIWTEGQWRAMGHKRVVVFGPGGERSIFHNGDAIPLLPAPLRALPVTAP